MHGLKTRATFYSFLIVALFFFPTYVRAADKPRQLWLYYSTNLLVDKNLDTLETIWRRAAGAGYTHVLLSDSKFNRLAEMDQRYFDHVERVKKLAKELNLTLIPAVFSVGYSNDLLSQDPNLAEGLPVRDSLFTVKDGEARLTPDPAVALDAFAWKDDVVVVMQKGVARVVDPAANARFVFKLNVPKFRCYHVSVEIKTQKFDGEPRIQALADDRALQFQNLGVKPTQDWTEHHVVFNSLDHTDVNLYFGVWGRANGTLEWRNWKIEEIGLLNVLRRPGAPLLVRAEKGDKTLVEGKDFEPVVDPHMGNVPYKGEYEVWHEPPPIKTKLPDGTRLRVSWFHPAIINDGQVSCCLSEPALDEVLADQAQRMRKLFGASGYMMSHDEIRTLGWDAACQKRKLDSGAMLAANVRQCTKLLGESDVYVWSDMFDPSHNAVEGNYYLVNGSLAGSWKGLEQRVTIVNWNFGKRDESLKFFADHGHKQIIAGYYDGPVEQVKDWLESAKKVKGVEGIMYTTWQNKYDDLEKFAKACKE